MKMFRQYLLIIPLMSSCFLFVSCGNSSALNSIVNNVSINQIEEDGKITLDAEFGIGAPGIQLPAVTFPIMANGSQKGTVSLVSNGPGQNAVRISANLSEIINLPEFGDGLLPDGEMLPIIGVGGAKIISLPLGGGNNTLYLATGEDTAMLGVAVVIKQLDSIGRTILGVNTFVPFQGNGFAGTAGFFTSVQPGQSGIGIFLDVKGILDRNDQTPVEQEAQSAILASINEEPELMVNEKGDVQEIVSAIEFVQHHTGDDDDTEKLDKYLYKLSRKKKQLSTEE